MEQQTPNSTPARQAATNGLAVVGFIALITLGLVLAVTVSRWVPNVVNGLGSAAVYLGSVFTPGTPDNASSLSVVSTSTPASTATSTISFGEPAVTTPAPAKPAPRRTIAPSAGQETSGTYQIGTSTPAKPTLSGLPDLTVAIDAVGYLATTSADSFVATSTVPANTRPAVRFTISNIGTNATGPWRFSASIPTATGYIFVSQPQQSLLPGDSIQYTLGFDQANTGRQTISVTANSDHSVEELNDQNDSASIYLTILGS